MTQENPLNERLTAELAEGLARARWLSDSSDPSLTGSESAVNSVQDRSCEFRSFLPRYT